MRSSALLRGLTKAIGICVIALVTCASIFISLNERLFSSSHVRSPWVRALADLPVLLEEQTYDRREAYFYRKKPVDPDVVMLTIDDLSIQKIGRFPWSRSIWAQVLDRLTAFEPKVVAFDVVFSEPERFCAGSPSPDSEFVAAINRFQASGGRSVILALGFTDDPEAAAKELPVEVQASAATGKVVSTIATPLPYVNGTTIPTPEILSAFPKIAHISSIASADGVFRRIPLLLPANINTNTDVLPTLALAAYQVWADSGPRKTSVTFTLNGEQNFFDLELSDASERKMHVELGEFGELRIRFRGGMEKYPALSVGDLLAAPKGDAKLKDLLQGKTIFIGSTAFAAHDIRHTPVDAALPGVYMHANVFSMLRDRLFTKPARESMAASLAIFLLALPLLLLVMSKPWPIWHLITLMFLISAAILVDLNFLLPQGYTIALGAVILGLITTYSWSTIFEFIGSLLERRRIRSTFQRYVAPAIVRQMLSHPELLKVGGQKRNVSMMFSDVRDFTSISEKLTPQELAQLLNRYMGRMTEILFDSNGTLDKYIGDAIVGFWGAPFDLPNHAAHALRGAVQMVEALPPINAEFANQGFPQISIGIGINSGDVSVGNMGSDRIFQYTALGDNMNLASRLEGLTKNYGVQLLASEFTIGSLGDEANTFLYRPVDRVRVKGKAQAVGIYEVLHPGHPFAKNADARLRFQKAFELYQAKKFNLALSEFEALAGTFPEDKPTRIHIGNCHAWIKTPPPAAWDGATTFTTK